MCQLTDGNSLICSYAASSCCHPTLYRLYMHLFMCRDTSCRDTSSISVHSSCTLPRASCHHCHHVLSVHTLPLETEVRKALLFTAAVLGWAELGQAKLCRICRAPESSRASQELALRAGRAGSSAELRCASPAELSYAGPVERTLEVQFSSGFDRASGLPALDCAHMLAHPCLSVHISVYIVCATLLFCREL